MQDEAFFFVFEAGGCIHAGVKACKRRVVRPDTFPSWSFSLNKSALVSVDGIVAGGCGFPLCDIEIFSGKTLEKHMTGKIPEYRLRGRITRS